MSGRKKNLYIIDAKPASSNANVLGSWLIRVQDLCCTGECLKDVAFITTDAVGTLKVVE